MTRYAPAACSLWVGILRMPDTFLYGSFCLNELGLQSPSKAGLSSLKEAMWPSYLNAENVHTMQDSKFCFGLQVSPSLPVNFTKWGRDVETNSFSFKNTPSQ